MRLPSLFSSGKLILLLLLCSCGIGLAQQDSTVTVTLGKRITFHSKILQQDRVLYIYEPPVQGFSKKDVNYPVLYLLDGDAYFTNVASMVGFLSSPQVRRFPEMIVVGITNIDRNHDLTPTNSVILPDGVDSSFTSTGGGPDFQRFIADELIPYIKSHYSTDPFRILAGHSLGGEFVIQVLETQPALFNAYIAISPFLFWDDEVLVTNIKTLQKQRFSHQFLYLARGNEHAFTINPLQHFYTSLSMIRPEGLTYQLDVLQNESHQSIAQDGFYHGLSFLYSKWMFPWFYSMDAIRFDQVLTHYKMLSDFYGYSITPSEKFINSIGYNFLFTKNPAAALDAFTYNIERHPGSFTVYDSMGDGLMAAGKKAEAIKMFEKCLELNPGNVSEMNKIRSIKGEK